MRTSAEDLHLPREDLSRAEPGGERLFMDLDICASAACKVCTVRCSYLYHPDNNGVLSLMELVHLALVCRRCEEPHCVNACPHDALEQSEALGRLLVRHTMRCVSCRSCSHACPYGTIYPELVPLLVHNCDLCEGRRHEKGEPLCVQTCPHGALSVVADTSVSGERRYPIGRRLLVHSTHWERDNE